MPSLPEGQLAPVPVESVALAVVATLIVPSTWSVSKVCGPQSAIVDAPATVYCGPE